MCFYPHVTLISPNIHLLALISLHWTNKLYPRDHNIATRSKFTTKQKMFRGSCMSVLTCLPWTDPSRRIGPNASA